VNPLPACRLADRAEVWVCPLCGRTLAKGMTGSSYIDPTLACPPAKAARHGRPVPVVLR
jgi:hypothetical protein